MTMRTPSFRSVGNGCLLTKAREKKAEKERQRNEHTAKIGAERLRLLIPSNAKAVILSVNYG